MPAATPVVYPDRSIAGAISGKEGERYYKSLTDRLKRLRAGQDPEDTEYDISRPGKESPKKKSILKGGDEGLSGPEPGDSGGPGSPGPGSISSEGFGSLV